MLFPNDDDDDDDDDDDGTSEYVPFRSTNVLDSWLSHISKLYFINIAEKSLLFYDMLSFAFFSAFPFHLSLRFPL